jgi:CBS domain-containing protein
MNARDIMSHPVFTVGVESTLEEVANLLLAHRVGCAPVVDAEGKLVGMITETEFMAEGAYVPFSAYQYPKLFGEWLTRDNLEKLYETGRTIKASQVMRTPVVAVLEQDPVSMVVQLMLQSRAHHIPVVRDGAPVGIIARHDLLRLMAREEQPTLAAVAATG